MANRHFNKQVTHSRQALVKVDAKTEKVQKPISWKKRHKKT
jgi:hypothetical protein